MRLWSVHPRYLDRQGLLGLWREGLLAQKVLGAGPPYDVPYGKHPQLDRFKLHKEPIVAISYYLKQVFLEADRRFYKFNKTLIVEPDGNPWTCKLWVPQGQIEYEFKHLMNKLKNRDPVLYKHNQKETSIKVHPLFTVNQESQEVSQWERVKEI